MNNSTVERQENVCRERRLLFGDQKSFPRTGFQAIWKFQLRVPSKRKQGPIHHPNLTHFGRNSSSSEVVDFYKETSRKADKTNPSQRGNKELYWDALPLSPVGLQKSMGMAWGPRAHSTGASLAKSHNEIKENWEEGGKKIHMAPLLATVYCYKEGLNTYQISKPFRDVWKKDESEQKSLKSFVIFPAEMDYTSSIFNSNRKALELCVNYKVM